MWSLFKTNWVFMKAKGMSKQNQVSYKMKLSNKDERTKN